MSIQRWDLAFSMFDSDDWQGARMGHNAGGEYVTYADHVAATEEAYGRGFGEASDLCDAATTGYLRGVSDERARIRKAVEAREKAAIKYALDAARETVISAVATKTEVVTQSRYESGVDLDSDYQSGWRDGMKCARGVSLAAIDALKEGTA